MKKRKVVYITGTRADYGVMRSTLDAMRKHPKLDLCLIVTGMHLSKFFGLTVEEVKKDKFKIAAEVPIGVTSDKGASMARALGTAVIGITRALEKIKPDILYIMGDRIEMLAGAVSASLMNIPIVHMSGGDVSGSVDDSVRHAITKFAHIHLPMTKLSAERIKKMGEESWRVHVIGTPGINLRKEKIVPAREVAKKLGFKLNKKIFIVIQHPVTTEDRESGKQMGETMNAVTSFGEQTVVIYPNADAGSISIIKTIEKYRNLPFLRVFKTLPRNFYLGILNIADAIVGNSSSGVVEAPSFNVPAIDIGTRQKDREHGPNVIEAPYDSKKIRVAIKKALSRGFRTRIKKSKNPYVNKNTEKKIANIVASVKITKKLLQKHMAY